MHEEEFYTHDHGDGHVHSHPLVHDHSHADGADAHWPVRSAIWNPSSVWSRTEETAQRC